MKFKQILNNQSFKIVLGFLKSSIATQVISFISSIFVIRSLGPEVRGYYSFLTLMGFFLVPIFSFGFSAGLNYFVASKKYQASAVISSIIIVALTRSVFIILIIQLLYFLELFGTTGNNIPYIYVFIVSLMFPFNLMKESLHRLLLADSKYNHANILNVFFSIPLPLMLLILVVFYGLQLNGVVIAMVVSTLMTLIATLYFIVKNYGLGGIFKIKYNQAFVKDAFGYGIKGWIGDIAVSANHRIDQLIISYFLNSRDLGLYSICPQIGMLLWVLPGSALQLLLNRGAQQKDDEKRKAMISRYHAFFMMISVVLGVILICFIDIMIKLLFGDAFLQIVNPMRVYLIGSIIYVGALILTKNLVGQKNIAKTSKIQIVSAAIGITTALVLIPYFGLMGAAISSVLSYLAAYLMCVYYFSDLKLLVNGVRQITKLKNT